MRLIYKILFVVSVTITLLALVSLISYGLNLGVDFRGGSSVELQFTVRPTVMDLTTTLGTSDVAGIHDASVTPVGEQDVLIKTTELSEAEHQQLLALVSRAYPDAGMTELKFDSVGPVIGSELKGKSITAIAIVLAAVCLYIALVFRKMAGTLSPWTMGIAAIIALSHDIIIPLGVFAWLGHAHGVEISAVFVAAVLTILGYSISDTVVVFDRVRENMVRVGSKLSFPDLVHRSIMETLVRSLNTTFTTLLALVAIFFFGGESVKYFALALIIGVALGSYSSIGIASPLLVWWSKPRKAR